MKGRIVIVSLIAFLICSSLTSCAVFDKMDELSDKMINELDDAKSEKVKTDDSEENSTVELKKEGTTGAEPSEKLNKINDSPSSSDGMSFFVSDDLCLDLAGEYRFSNNCSLNYYLLGSNTLKVYSYIPSQELIFGVKQDDFDGTVYVSCGDYSYPDDDLVFSTSNGFDCYTRTDDKYVFVYSGNYSQDIKLVVNTDYNLSDITEYLENNISLISRNENAIYPNVFDVVQDIYAASDFLIKNASDISYISLACIKIGDIYLCEPSNTTFDTLMYDSCYSSEDENIVVGINEISSGYSCEIFSNDTCIIGARMYSDGLSEDKFLEEIKKFVDVEP